MFCGTFHENPLFHFAQFKNCFQRTLCSDFRSQLLFLFYENRPAKTQFQLHPFSTTTRPEKSRTPPDRSATPYYVESFHFSARIHGTNIQNIESIVLNLDLKPNLWIDCRQHEQCSSYFMKTDRQKPNFKLPLSPQIQDQKKLGPLQTEAQRPTM